MQTDSDDVALFSRHDSAEPHRIVDVHKVCFKDKLLKHFKLKLMWISGATDHKNHVFWDTYGEASCHETLCSLGTLTTSSIGSMFLLLKACRMISTASWWVTACRDTPSTDTSSKPAWDTENRPVSYVALAKSHMLTLINRDWSVTRRASLVDAAPPGKILSIFTIGCTLDSDPPDILIPDHNTHTHHGT